MLRKPLGRAGGAAPDRLMTHIAMQQSDEQGNVVTWGEDVTDEEYSAS
jgi:hypothetical protein